MTPKLQAAEYLSDYMIRLHYPNGLVKVADLAPYLNKGIYRELRDIEIFKSFRVSFNTLEWPNGADIDPESLWEIGE